MKKLTVSVAAYNIEHYIDKLMDSIISSSRLSELEVLIVNDGSTDKTVEKANKYISLYPNDIKLIDKENGGHGSTINAGVMNASCKYFKSIDGDDWFDSDGLGKILCELEDCDADLIITDYINVYESDNISKLISHEGIESQRVQYFSDCYRKLTDICYHNIIYRTDLLRKNSIKLTEHSFYVDNEYVMYPLQYVESVIYLSIPLYCYRLGRKGQSVSVVSLQKNIAQLNNIVTTLFNWYKSISWSIASDRKWLISNYISALINFFFYVEFSFKKSNLKCNEMIQMDDLFKSCEEVYYKNVGYALRVWRKSRKSLYKIIWIYFSVKRRFKKILGDI